MQPIKYKCLMCYGCLSECDLVKHKEETEHNHFTINFSEVEE